MLDDEEVRLEVGSLLRRKRRCVVGFVSEGDIELVVVDGRLGDGGWNVGMGRVRTDEEARLEILGVIDVCVASDVGS